MHDTPQRCCALANDKKDTLHPGVYHNRRKSLCYRPLSSQLTEQLGAELGSSSNVTHVSGQDKPAWHSKKCGKGQQSLRSPRRLRTPSRAHALLIRNSSASCREDHSQAASAHPDGKARREAQRSSLRSSKEREEPGTCLFSQAQISTTAGGLMGKPEHVGQEVDLNERLRQGGRVHCSVALST